MHPALKLSGGGYGDFIAFFLLINTIIENVFFLLGDLGLRYVFL